MPDPAHVTLVAHNVGSIGGMERQLAELVTGLLDDGHSVTVISRRCELPAHPQLEWVRVPGPQRPFTIAFPFFAMLAAWKLRRHGRGLVHATGALVPNRADVISVHFCNEAVWRQRALNRNRRATLLYRLNGRVALALGRLGERVSFRPARTQRLVAVSDGVARELAEFFPAMADRVKTIPNAVDHSAFRRDGGTRAAVRSDLGIPSDGLAAVFIGSEWEGKGLRPAIAALREAPNWRLLVVGAGDREAYHASAEREGVGDRVIFTGPTREPQHFYSAADAFIFPSIYEAFPLVALEAAASGLPLLASRVNGIDEILEDGVNGWYVTRDGSDIAAHLRALEDPKRREQMARAAEAAVAGMTWRSVVDAYEHVYAEVLDGRA